MDKEIFDILFDKGFVYGLFGLAILFLLRENATIKNDIKIIQQARIQKAEEENKAQAIIVTKNSEVLSQVSQLLEVLINQLSDRLPDLKNVRSRK